MSEAVNEEMGNTNLLTNSSSHPLTNTSTHSLKTPIIQVKHLSKRYQIGMDRTYKTFCESITDTIKSPLKRLKSFSRQEEIFWALKDVNFEVFPGEVVGIIGRNGAGKTTLLKILSRITHPTEGEVVLRGRVASLLEVGTGFHPELTGRENIYFNGAILGMTKQEIEDKFDEIVDFSGVKDFLDTPLKRYSSGMQVRLAFAVAAHLEPEILVVDEVLAVGDAEFQKKCLGKMSEVAKGGRTVLFVSHNMSAVQNLCSRGLCLENGQIQHQGAMSDVVEAYLSASADLGTLERDVSCLPRRPGEGTSFRYVHARVNVTNRYLRMWKPLSLDLEFESSTGATEVCPGFSIFAMDGMCVFTCEGEDNQFLLDLKPGDKGEIHMVVPHPALAPGRYMLRLGARSNAQMLDWIDNVLHFEVSPLGSSLTSSRRTLGMRPQSEWTLR